MFISNKVLRAWYRLQENGARLRIESLGEGLYKVTFIVSDLHISGLIRERQLQHVGQKILLVDVGLEGDHDD